MRMQRFIILAVIFLFYFQAVAIASDMIFLSNMGIHADKSTLMITWGHHDGNAAIMVSFGPGLGGRMIGIVYAELNTKDKEKISAAKIKLAQVLNSNETVFSVENQLTKRIGLTFKKYVQYDMIKQ